MRAARRRSTRAVGLALGGILTWAWLAASPAAAQTSVATCASAVDAPLVPTDLALCARLEQAVRAPAALPQNEYEEILQRFLLGYCHRNAEAGWVRDKRMRDTGPYVATLEDGAWVGNYHGTHAPVVIWYSPEMIAWLETNRPLDEAGHEAPPPAEIEPIPDGAIMIKEMFTPPTGPCRDVDPLDLFPSSGVALMVRSVEGSHDGWFWGWFGMTGLAPDWPPNPQNSYPNMGFGQYCMNCHASSEDGLTFASLTNVEGYPGEPLVFLSQDFFGATPQPSHHRLVTLPGDDAPRLGQPLFRSSGAFVDAIPAHSLPAVGWNTVENMPSETYDNVWVEAGGPSPASQFITSDQCIGCHDAGGTGLQFDMTMPNPHGDDLLNLSPYATWRTSPMGLGGRDPIFYAQLASETETFHPDDATLIENTCLGCHGILGQRQFAIDQGPEVAALELSGATVGELAAEAEGKDPATVSGDDCRPFLRSTANAVPYPADNPSAHLARYGALARDGISCTACHHMVLTEAERERYAKEPQNFCLEQRQELLNPGLTGLAKTFTGSFVVGPPDELYGPFEDPRTKPMEHAMGIEPVEVEAMQSSEVCASCHTVHLPVLYDGKILRRTYEQTTYPEWAFSAYRTGETPDGPLPGGKGDRAETCQQCHMPSAGSDGEPFRSRIAGIQELSNFPEAEHTLPAAEIDLPVREGFAHHTLAGLNVFFVKMAQQFPDVLGIRTQDPMLVGKGLDPLLYTEQVMIDQAANDTAKVTVDRVEQDGESLLARVTVENLTGHKLPSGVGFRRAFLEVAFLGARGETLWVSGATDEAGLIVDGFGEPLPGELWWKDDCSGLRHPDRLVYQPHHQVIDRQDQAQIYQELVTAPADVPNPVCGKDPTPGGHFTTSFLSICDEHKDNRLLPHGFLGYEQRLAISKALGAGEPLAEETGSDGVDGDPDYDCSKAPCKGQDSLVYKVPLSALSARPASVRATLYYQAIPPYYLQDRFCTSQSTDTQRLYFLASHLNLEGTQAESWKLEIVGDEAAVPGKGKGAEAR